MFEKKCLIHVNTAALCIPESKSGKASKTIEV